MRQGPLVRFFEFFNYKTSVLGASVMGLIVFYVNASHGYIPASIAAFKQVLYTFFMGGVILHLLYALLNKFAHNISGMLMAVILTSFTTILLIYFIHTMKGTPEPVNSTLPTVFLAPLGFLSVAIHKRFIKKEC